MDEPFSPISMICFIATAIISLIGAFTIVEWLTRFIDSAIAHFDAYREFLKHRKGNP